MNLRAHIPDLFSLLVAAAGWYYLFYSRAAQNLEGIEQPQLNLKRIRLRRVGGMVMMLFAIFFCIGWHTVDERHPAGSPLIWLIALTLLALMVLLALVDIRLTARLRKVPRKTDG